MPYMPPRTGGRQTPSRCKSPAAGTVTGYRQHIEKRKVNKNHRICAACREAIRINHARYRNRRIMNGAHVTRTSVKGSKLVGGQLMRDPTGTRRRLLALNAIGWSFKELGRRLGSEGSNIRNLSQSHAWTYPATVEKVRAIYDELSMLPPPDTSHVRQVKTLARQKGFPPPLAWEDEMIEDPYSLPFGLNKTMTWNWFWNTASMTERIEWVLENGFPGSP